ncbi:uncharacterized protein CCOS01_05123 [Colletotrichum costaricense]|uniref:Uncharacterized protein n=1 Tax=Colletotrichum costaricense TaxID=1209916 RepID=A0AAI9Z008_9PEZI|nr:uncharacterized protein CCOS01_05123 [Colletotrichum costaricense]KAK1530020.1 hypothetical protein CCOS01_05123 [Colletotrichum costaricense]
MERIDTTMSQSTMGCYNARIMGRRNKSVEKSSQAGSGSGILWGASGKSSTCQRCSSCRNA